MSLTIKALHLYVMGDPFRVDILISHDYPRVLRTPRLPRGDAFSVFPYKAFPKIGDAFRVFSYKAFSKIRRRFQRLFVQSIFEDSETISASFRTKHF